MEALGPKQLPGAEPPQLFPLIGSLAQGTGYTASLTPSLSPQLGFTFIYVAR